MISVIIPAFNAEKTIAESLNSLIDQTFEDYEVIVVDDGSTDNTSNVIREGFRNNKKIKYFYKNNGGVSSARNKGIQNSKGEFVCFLDADDYFESTYLERMHKKIRLMESDICYCGYNVLQNGIVKRKKSKFKTSNILIGLILGQINVSSTGWLIKKSYLNRVSVSFNESNSWGEDIEFFLEVVANTNKITYVNDYLTNYRVNHDSAQLSSFSLDKIDYDYKSIKRIVGNKKINYNVKIENALLHYRLQALIVYRLLSGFKRKESTNDLLRYYNKYESLLVNNYYKNKFRSLKLIIKKFILRYKIKSLKNQKYR